MTQLTEGFDRFVEGLDYPMFIVTTIGDDGVRAGCLVGFTTQCSIDPARFLVCLSDKNHTYRVASRATHLAVHIVDRDDSDLAKLFGGQTGDEVDKFARCQWTDGPEGVPVLEGTVSWFVGRILDRVDMGDHIGHVLDPVAVQPQPVDGLEFHDTRHIEAGHPADE